MSSTDRNTNFVGLIFIVGRFVYKLEIFKHCLLPALSEPFNRYQIYYLDPWTRNAYTREWITNAQVTKSCRLRNPKSEVCCKLSLSSLHARELRMAPPRKGWLKRCCVGMCCSTLRYFPTRPIRLWCSKHHTDLSCPSPSRSLCMWLCVYLSTNRSIFLSIYLYLCARTSVSVYIYMCVCMLVRVYLHIYMHMHICIYTHIYIYVCMHACMYVCMYV